MLEAQSRRGFFSSQYVCRARPKFTLSKSRHLPFLEKKKQTHSFHRGPRGPVETNSAAACRGAHCYGAQPERRRPIDAQQKQ